MGVCTPSDRFLFFEELEFVPVVLGVFPCSPSCSPLSSALSHVFLLQRRCSGPFHPAVLVLAPFGLCSFYLFASVCFFV